MSWLYYAIVSSLGLGAMNKCQAGLKHNCIHLQYSTEQAVGLVCITQVGWAMMEI